MRDPKKLYSSAISPNEYFSEIYGGEIECYKILVFVNGIKDEQQNGYIVVTPLLSGNNKKNFVAYRQEVEEFVNKCVERTKEKHNDFIHSMDGVFKTEETCFVDKFPPFFEILNTFE